MTEKKLASGTQVLILAGKHRGVIGYVEPPTLHTHPDYVRVDTPDGIFRIRRASLKEMADD